MRQLSPLAERLLRLARARTPNPLRVAGYAEREAVRELVEHNLVREHDVDGDYSGRITALAWERKL